MDSLAERIALLRRVHFFTGAPEEALPLVAAALVPISVAVGEALFRKGDLGESMYLITSGRVNVHDGDLVFNQLGPGDVVGEMAILDAEPRSASVTAVEPTTLLCLGQEALYDLLIAHPGVARGVIQILTRHLRARVSERISDYAFIKQVMALASAAEELNTGTYTPGCIAEVAARDDALGELARTFDRMAAEVINRERNLRRQVQELKIEIDRARQQVQVAEITESDYFRELQQRAADLRASHDDDDE